ncbi:hypothetical protein E5082_15715 [Streptomyces griseoluteus]|uniref:Uncharacterized protein n=1 Tax=Streptomyces griseoluteus TaxID=29306 RepID=A0A4Z1DJ52_STRGP|nr:DUF5994 family protein [Streptomyces griseoluteus]TGN83039.1 hypothetical protein E5082_15715 [Streptomyces griseoluteus]GHF17498.1 hypothetical protein GCM10017776_39020 [Streptomyces griseoluteus]
MASTEGISHTGFHAGSSPAKDDSWAAAQVARRRVRIMSATLYPAMPHPEPVVAAPAARLALKTDGASRGLLDGAWWPRSRDLLSELPALTNVLDPLWGRITRIAVNPEHWPVIPRKIPVNRHIVKAGWFTAEIDPHKLLLLSYGTGRFDLLVIPPGTGAESAARLMAAASDHDGPPLTASALIAADAARHPSDQALDPDEAWEYEGGASAVSAAATGQTGTPGPAGRLIIGR